MTFRKVEEGMILQSEDGKAYAFGLPETVEKMTGVGGKAGISIKGLGGEVKGEQYTKVKYNWQIVSGSPLPYAEMETVKGTIETSSGTAVASLTNASLVDSMPRCKKCGTPLFLVGEGFNCQKCGEPTV